MGCDDWMDLWWTAGFLAIAAKKHDLKRGEFDVVIFAWACVCKGGRLEDMGVLYC
jgi:uncharacterized protein YwqG